MNRQKLHLKAPDHWVNDPNGFIFYNGYYHLFYQYFPYAAQWGTMHWGHAVSRDLINWEHKGIALFPTKRGDANGCFSGCAIEKDGELYLAYTGVRYEEMNPQDIHTCPNDRYEASQMMISSRDGIHFDNWKDKREIIPPVTNTEIGHRTHTRDPKIWRGKDAWYMILGSSLREEQGEVLFYKSQDLHSWEYVNKALKSPAYGWMWECPDYFETQGGEVLMVSAMGFPKKQQNHTICFLVEFKENTCEMNISDEYQFLDYGLDLYAPQTTLDKDGRRIMVAWLRMPEATEEGWIGMFCSPRVVEVENGHICFRMHPDIRKAYSRKIENLSETAKAGCKVDFELQDGEKVDIGGFLIYRKGNHIYTDRRLVYPCCEEERLVFCTPELEGKTHLEVLVDRNMVEVFINDGEYVISNAVYHLEKKITCNVQKEISLQTVEEELP